MRQIYEAWKPIVDYESIYSINTSGLIYNHKTQKFKKPTIARHGYLCITLYRNNIHKTFLVHRLVAVAFIPNPHNKITVNHKDGNRLNNNVENLEWSSYSENQQHSYTELGKIAYMKGRTGILNHNSKPIIMCDFNLKQVRIFDSIKDAERELNILHTSIINHLKGRTKSCNKHIFRYEQTDKI